MLRKEISHPVFYGDLVYKLRRVRCEANFVSSGSKIVKRLRRRKYDPLIIENTIGLVLGPSTALYRSFLEHCTLTNKAVGTIWRDLSKPPQRRQGPDPRPLWLLVGTPLVLGPELASRRAEHSHSGGCHYIFLLYCFLRHSASVECLSAIALRSPSALANQNVSMELISQSRSYFSENQFTPTSCMCLYTRWEINTRSQNSFWDWSKMHCSSVGRKPVKTYQCLISVSISTRDALQMVVCRHVYDQSA